MELLLTPACSHVTIKAQWNMNENFANLSRPQGGLYRGKEQVVVGEDEQYQV